MNAWRLLSLPAGIESATIFTFYINLQVGRPTWVMFVIVMVIGTPVWDMPYTLRESYYGFRNLTSWPRISTYTPATLLLYFSISVLLPIGLALLLLVASQS